MGNRVCRSLRDVGMTQQRLIDLSRRDFLAAAIDHLGLAAVKGEEAVGVEASNIASSKPAIDEARTVELWRVEIARCHCRPSEQDLAMFAGGNLAAALRDNLDCAFARDTAGARPVWRGGRQVGRNLSRFARAIVFHNRHAQRSGKSLPHFLRQGRAARDDK